MIIKKLLLLFLILFLSFEIYPKENNQIIESILIFGNVRTKESLIRRALKCREGQEFDAGAINESKKELKDLGIFTHVDIETKKGEKGRILIVIVKERSFASINPIVTFGNEKYNAYWGAKIGLVNFTGRNQELFLTGTIGGLKKIGLTYQNNFFIDFFWGVNLESLWYKNKFYDFNEERIGGEFFVGRKISQFTTFLWTKYEKIKIKDDMLYNEPENLFKLGADITYDSRDWMVFPSEGIFIQLGAYKALNEKKTTVYNRYTSRFSSFLNLWKKNVLALDLNATLSDGHVPLYDRVFLGGYQTLRGLSFGKYAGTSFIVFSLEYRIPLTRLSKSSSAENFLGSVFYLFSDIGAITENRKDFRLKGFQSNSGVGFFLILSKEGGLRLDLSVSPGFRFTVGSEWKF